MSDEQPPPQPQVITNQQDNHLKVEVDVPLDATGAPQTPPSPAPQPTNQQPSDSGGGLGIGDILKSPSKVPEPKANTTPPAEKIKNVTDKTAKVVAHVGPKKPHRINKLLVIAGLALAVVGLISYLINVGTGITLMGIGFVMAAIGALVKFK